MTLLHETGFLYIKGINFRIRNCNREGIRENLTILEFLSVGRVTLLHETGFLYIKGINIFGYEIVIEKESEKISKFSEKIILKPL